MLRCERPFHSLSIPYKPMRHWQRICPAEKKEFSELVLVVLACGKKTQPRTKTSDEGAFGWLSVKNSAGSRQEVISQGLARWLSSDGARLWSWQAETAVGVLRPDSCAAKQRA
jgi:hypothetical protein